MSVHCFNIPALSPEPALSEYNALCLASRVVATERQFVAAGAQSYWALWVVVAEGPGPLPAALKRASQSGAGVSAGGVQGDRGGKPDYRQLLSPADFAVFAALRAWRKAQAEAEGVPLFALFSNEQMAELARQRCATLPAMAAIEGVGEAKLARYGASVLSTIARIEAEAGLALSSPVSLP